MSYTITISNEQYERLETLASALGQTPEETLAALPRDALPRDGHDSEASAETNDLEHSPLFQVIGSLTDPGIEPEPGWTERHDIIIAEKA
ncbi:MAG: hypothetical protein OJF49_001628 [Ktedonobacterales bacterium]|nr:MAG: hypothetical protein OJF49_001628 [Ktedonobacterales bacterium]